MTKRHFEFFFWILKLKIHSSSFHSHTQWFWMEFLFFGSIEIKYSPEKFWYRMEREYTHTHTHTFNSTRCDWKGKYSFIHSWFFFVPIFNIKTFHHHILQLFFRFIIIWIIVWNSYHHQIYCWWSTSRNYIESLKHLKLFFRKKMSNQINDETCQNRKKTFIDKLFIFVVVDK